MGREFGADRAGRGSLDETLRNKQSLTSAILDILQDIYDSLENGTAFHKPGVTSFTVKPIGTWIPIMQKWRHILSHFRGLSARPEPSAVL